MLPLYKKQYQTKYQHHMDLEHLVLNDQNTENGEMPQLTDEEKEQIKTVRILKNSNLTCIPHYAFYGWSLLESVDIEDDINITIIGDRAFGGCESLKSVNIPNTVMRIRGSAFSHCKSLQSVNIPNGVTAIGEYAFCRCESLKSVNIPNGVTRIGDEAFSECWSLQSVNIPNGVTRIEEEAFRGCSSLLSVNIPNGVTTIQDFAFWGCESLKSICVPNSVTEIGFDAFAVCDRLEQRQRNGTNYHSDTITWLRQRFVNLPIHDACYYAHDTQPTVDLLSSLIQDNRQALAATDAMGMTPLDILCYNPCATIEMVGVLVQNDPSLEETGLSPFMLAAVLSGCGLDVVFVLAMNDLNTIL